jgi:hypothetical protein
MGLFGGRFPGCRSFLAQPRAKCCQAFGLQIVGGPEFQVSLPLRSDARTAWPFVVHLTTKPGTPLFQFDTHGTMVGTGHFGTNERAGELFAEAGGGEPVIEAPTNIPFAGPGAITPP